jgi:PAS domain S-box-containing protein
MRRPDMYWHADTAGQCTWVSDSYRSFVGRDAQDARDDGWAMAIHPDDRQQVLANVQEKTRLGLGFIARYQLQAADGQYYDVRDSGYPAPWGYQGSVTVLRLHAHVRPWLGVGEVVQFRHRRPIPVPVPLEEPSLEVCVGSAG